LNDFIASTVVPWNIVAAVQNVEQITRRPNRITSVPVIAYVAKITANTEGPTGAGPSERRSRSPERE